MARYLCTREAECASEFLADIDDRLNNRAQITTDGLPWYVEAMNQTFGDEVDFVQVKKKFPSKPNIDKELGYSDKANWYEEASRDG